jgi:hypothetical protein
MRHLDDGTLRRMSDEPLAISDADRAHFDSCIRCQESYRLIAAEAEQAASLLTVDASAARPAPAAQALPELRARLAQENVRRVPAWRSRLPFAWPGTGRPLGGVAAAAVLIGALTLTPAGSLAQSLITIFQPKQVAVVPVTAAELQTLPDLRKYGTMKMPAKVQPQTASTAQQAAQLSGIQVLTPGSLPSSVPSTVRYTIVPGQTATFTFNAAKARKTAAKAGKHLNRMPAGIDGSTLQLTTGVGVVATYGTRGQIPGLVIGEMKAPRVSSSGVSAKELEDYLLGLPGVSPQLAQAIRNIGDPSSTLPIPVPVNMATSQDVTVQGVHGVAIGDQTGLGSAAIWVNNGMIYGVAGPLREDQVLSVANSLH